MIQSQLMPLRYPVGTDVYAGRPAHAPLGVVCTSVESVGTIL
jgi:hypothetical protein